MSSPTGSPSPDTLGGLFAAAAATAPSRAFLRTRRGSVSYAAMAEWSAAVAGGLRDCGVAAGDHVVVAATNRPEVVAAWLACLRVGACFTPVSPEVPSRHLADLCGLVRPAAVVAEADRAPEVAAAVEGGGAPRPVVVALAGRACAGVDRRWSDLERSGRGEGWHPADPSDRAAVMSTSGTTGASKAVALSHRWFTKICETTERYWGFAPTDRFYCPLPLHHMDGLAMTVVPAMYHRTTAAIGERFSVRGFWDEVRAFDATVFDFLGSTLTLLWKQLPRPDDADNPARLGWGVPLPAFQQAFEERFGCVLVDCYGSTDVGIPVYGQPGVPKPPGSCGRAVEGYDVAILDERGRRVPPGVVGEIAVRPDDPDTILQEYVGRPVDTLETWRGLWHHTGDLGRLDTEGHLYFEGRRTDSIRRRGENISAQELEALVLAHEQVEDVAAVAVPSELTEDDVKLVVACRSGASTTEPELAAWLGRTLPRAMTVRYVEIVADLPRTSTGKVAKAELRERWRTAATWDAEAAAFLGGDDVTGSAWPGEVQR
jgi:crotonobetaine/carnitine-CoA ligase